MKLFHKRISEEALIDILFPKLFWPTVRKNCSTKIFWNWRLNAENLQTFWDDTNSLFKQRKARTINGTEYFYNFFLDVSPILYITTIQIQVRKKYWNSEIYKKSFLYSWVEKTRIHLATKMCPDLGYTHLLVYLRALYNRQTGNKAFKSDFKLWFFLLLTYFVESCNL